MVRRWALGLLMGVAWPAWGATLAVLPFAAHTDRADLAPLGTGLADMLTTDLVAASDLTVVERTRLDGVLAELELQASGFVDPATAAEVGKGLGATAVVLGSLTAAGDTLRIDARVVDVATGTVVLTAEEEGPVDRFFDLERALALRVLDALHADVSAAERARLGEPWSGEGPLAFAARISTGKAVASGGGRDPSGPELRIVKSGGPVAPFVFVDGEALGRPTRKEPISLRLVAGRHEVAIGPDAQGDVLRCWGIAHLTAPSQLATGDVCDLPGTGASPYGTVLRGALVRFQVVDPAGSAVSYAIAVDGRVGGGGRYVTNLAPGAHTVAVDRSWSEKVVEVNGLGNEVERTVRHTVSHCHGRLELAPGAERTVQVSTAGCSGFDP